MWFDEKFVEVEFVGLDALIAGRLGDDVPFLADADKVLDDFFSSCFAAGPENCAVYSDDGPEGVRAIYDDVLSAILDSPVAVPAHGSFAPDVVTYSDLMDTVRRAIYVPLQEFENLANILAGLSVGNGTLLAGWKQQYRVVYCPSSECRREGPWSDPCQDRELSAAREATVLVWCTDRMGKFQKTYDETRQYWQEVRNMSKGLGDWWVTNTVPCMHWSIEPAWTFDGMCLHIFALSKPENAGVWGSDMCGLHKRVFDGEEDMQG